MTSGAGHSSRSRDGALIGETVGAMELVDHHCYGLLDTREDPDRTVFESLLFGTGGPGPWRGSLFDTQVGFAIRRLCGPVLDLPPHADPDVYLERRAELGAAEVDRRLLQATGISEFFVGTGLRTDRTSNPAESAVRASAVAREVVQLETVAEEVVLEHRAGTFADECRARLAAAARTAVAFETVAAFRVGLDLAPERPSDAAVFTAAARWSAQLGDGATPRLADETLIRFLVWNAVDLGLPIQVHAGYGHGDVNVESARADPLLSMPLLRATAGAGPPIVLLHNYPFHRHAGYLAQVFDHVFVDVGPLQNVGRGGAIRVLAELLELAPFGSVLFSTGAFGLPELFHVGAAMFRESLTSLLEHETDHGDWSVDDALRIARLVGSENARRAYGVPG